MNVLVKKNKYIPFKLKKLNLSIANLIDERKKFEKKLKELENNLEEKNDYNEKKILSARSNDINNINNDEIQKVEKNSHNHAESSKKEEFISDEIEELLLIRKRVERNEIIKNYENHREKLVRKIEENQVRIRDKVYLHIFNNCNPVSSWEKILINKIDEELNEWIKLPHFEKDDYSFCSWLKKIEKFNFNNIKNFNYQEIDSLKEKYSKYLLKEKKLYEVYIQNQEKDLHKFEKIRLEKLIGQGSCGQVYKGSLHGQIVAVKKIPVIYLKDIDKEIKALKRLNHEHIVQYHGERAKGDNIYLIMEYAENGSLNRFIEKNKNNPQDWQLNYKFIDQITKGLIYLHSENIIHRDLKSHNVLITKDNIAKISDFGLAKIIDDSFASSGHKTKGTIRWMAPEVLKTGEHSFKSDIYSLGMVMWEIVAKGTIPFKQFDNNHTVMYNVVNENLKEVIPTDTPKELKEIIELCWREQPNERIDLLEIENQLDEMIHEAVIEVI